jgi:HlyD family secretion protein
MIRSRLLLAPAVLLLACGRSGPVYQGYVEGEFVNVAASQAGRLDRLAVARGDQVALGAPLFGLECAQEAAARQQAADQLKAAQAQLADLRLGKRPQEVDAVRAQLAQAQAQAKNLSAQLARDEAQFRERLISDAQMDQSRAAAATAEAQVRELRSQLAVAQLPGREDQIRAQSAQVEAAKAALAQAEWRLDQKTVAAPKAGLVQDTLYREGEWVQAGSPVARLLPPGNVKVRFFVPEAAVGRLQPGQAVTLSCDGCPDIQARITFISASAEFTPPVIYSDATRAKLVFMVEARPSTEDGARLHPGQPVTVAPR